MLFCLLPVSASAASCAEKKEGWEIHYDKAEEYAEQYACGLTLPEYNRATELNPEDPDDIESASIIG